MVNPLHRPTLISRIGLLILSQVVFVFLALALILFVPRPSKLREAHRARVHQTLESLSSLIKSHEQDFERNPQGFILNASKATTADKLFRATSIYSCSADRLKCLSSSELPAHDYDLLNSEKRPDSTLQNSLIELALSKQDGFNLTSANLDGTVVDYYRFALPSTGAMVICAEEISQFVVAPRAQLIQVISVLFAVSLIVSLLIFRLLKTRFKDPLERFTRGVEKTASGVQFVTVAQDDEVEMSRLAKGINRLSASMQREHSALEKAKAQAADAALALTASKQFLTTIIESSPSGVIVTDPTGQIILINKRALNEFRRSLSEALGMNIDSFFTVAGASGQPTDDASGFETVCWRKDGETFPAYIATALVNGDGGAINARLYIIGDIVDSRGFQDMMVRLDRMATRGEMAGDIGHEINNFLAVLLGNLELLPRSIAKGDEPSIKKKLDIMKTNVEKIARFADGLMESPQEDIVFLDSSMNQVVENVIAFMRHQNRFDGIDWVIQLEPGVVSAEMDEARIQQVMVNLLNNAAEAIGTVEGNHVLTVSTSHNSRKQPGIVRVDVRDNGAGVQKDKEKLLFRTRFTTKTRGHGIGLITCQRIIDQHQGSISYEFDDGAHFWFEVPVKHPQSHQGGPAVSSSAPVEAAV